MLGVRVRVRGYRTMHVRLGVRSWRLQDDACEVDIGSDERKTKES
jgi:hypothetical protein